jgi:hypothetical protein
MKDIPGQVKIPCTYHSLVLDDICNFYGIYSIRSRAPCACTCTQSLRSMNGLDGFLALLQTMKGYFIENKTLTIGN